MTTVTKSALFIAGPTASGKSALALDLAETLRGVIINADAMQLYAGLPILTACPAAADQARVPHRLYGVLDAGHACSVVAWRTMALAEMEAAWAARQVPILVGGTGLYFRVLWDGIAHIPVIPDLIRAEVRADLAKQGPAHLHQRLMRADPDSAARLAPGDSQRLARAWEVWQATGTPLSQWQRQKGEGGLGHRPDIAVTRFVLTRPRPDLYARCNRRFQAMVENGAIEEVSRLVARGLDPQLPAMKALGVGPLQAYLAGEMPLDAAIHLAQRDSRRYAKRQTTWLRHQCADWHWQCAQENYCFNVNNFINIIH